MKTSERFNRAIKALVKGFFDGTLMKGTCNACAVGNIIAYCTKQGVFDGNHGFWGNVFHTVSKGNQVLFKAAATGEEYYSTDDLDLKHPESYSMGLKEIESTGYSIEDLMRIEAAFENNTKYLPYSASRETVVNDQYKGLIAVVDVLCDIEGIEAAPYKAAFEYTEDFKPVNKLVLV